MVGVMLIMLFDKSTVTLWKGHVGGVRGHLKALGVMLSSARDESPGCVCGALHVCAVQRFIDQGDLVYRTYVIICV